MEKNYHYNVTFTAATRAGYSDYESTIIARAAQYVDECPTTVQGIAGMVWKNMMDSLEKWSGLPQKQEAEAIRIWTCFHFLPGDFGRIGAAVKRELVANPVSDDCLRAHLICNPESSRVALMVDYVKEAVQSDSNATMKLIRVGLAMHVLADTYAHQSFAGVPFKKINCVERISHCNLEVSDTLVSELRRAPRLSFLGEKSFSYTGHGQAGSWPDQPGHTLCYTIAWRKPGDQEIVRYNPLEFYCAYLHMIAAMRYIRGDSATFPVFMDRAGLIDHLSDKWPETRRALLAFTDAGVDKALPEHWGAYAGRLPNDGYDPLEGAEETMFRQAARDHSSFVLDSCPELNGYLEQLGA